MKKMLQLVFAVLVFISCAKDKNPSSSSNSPTKLTIFIMNDMHGQLDNFSKVKYIVDEEKTNTNVLLVSAGDLFSGNPIVDNYPEKGYPMIDLMNKVGVDVSVVGNHEFDYGEINLKARIEQADFKWVCANMQTNASVVPEVAPYTTVKVDDIHVTFLGLVETDGKENATIPSTHPWRVKNIAFDRPENVVGNYASLKTNEDADLLIALTHLGYSKSGGRLGDKQLANQYPFFDLIIGGHSHSKINEVVNDIPIYQAGSYLNYLGKIELTVRNKKITSLDYELIDLNTISNEDSNIKAVIDSYNDEPFFKEVVGFAEAYHERRHAGNFTADALRLQMGVDIAFQNTGGVRANIDQGDITKKEIFSVLPFNNPTMTYTMTVAEIKNFLKGTGAGFYYSGVTFERSGDDIIVRDLSGNLISDTTSLTVGLNDYIPAVFDTYFPATNQTSTQTDAETVINYLQQKNSQINYTSSNNYFRY